MVLAARDGGELQSVSIPFHRESSTSIAENEILEEFAQRQRYREVTLRQLEGTYQRPLAAEDAEVVYQLAIMSGIYNLPSRIPPRQSTPDGTT